MMKEKKIEIVTILTYQIYVRFEDGFSITLNSATEQERDERFDNIWNKIKEFKTGGFFSFGSIIVNTSKIHSISKTQDTYIGSEIKE